jgi:MSHA biogenesis protein MshO
MIIVIVITGIIGGIVAMFLRAPIQQYIDVSRRADITDIADTALRRVSRDLRLALPNSVRVTGTCDGIGTCFIEFLPTKGGGRYRAAQDCSAACTGNVLDFTAADNSFDVIGTMPTFASGDSIVVYNMTANPADANPNAYVGGNRAACAGGASSCSAGANPVTLAAAKLFPQDACQTDLLTGRNVGCRFQVISTPVTYMCSPVAGGTGGTLTRWQGYTIQSAQPTTLPGTGSSALLATNVSSCMFNYDLAVVAKRSGLVTMNLGITESGETVTLYKATHVSNVP